MLNRTQSLHHGRVQSTVQSQLSALNPPKPPSLDFMVGVLPIGSRLGQSEQLLEGSICFVSESVGLSRLWLMESGTGRISIRNVCLNQLQRHLKAISVTRRQRHLCVLKPIISNWKLKLFATLSNTRPQWPEFNLVELLWRQLKIVMCLKHPSDSLGSRFSDHLLLSWKIPTEGDLYNCCPSFLICGSMTRTCCFQTHTTSLIPSIDELKKIDTAVLFSS